MSKIKNKIINWPNYAKTSIHAPNSKPIFLVFIQIKQKMAELYEPKTMCLYMDIHTKFDSNRHINSSNMTILEQNQVTHFAADVRERSHMTSARFWQILSPPSPCQQLSALSDPP